MATNEETPNVEKLAPLYIVTGATDSMGSVITRKLAAQGKAVLLACRDEAKAAQRNPQPRHQRAAT